ncbi:hypothetical protein GCM10027169_07360 [Gordonia jinhuaensis]|uniref:Uncharacterized protein n=1 Tax=Gordonia jinhuaensis TaxID=1517702 RepID=A0A916SXF5_9ACTN|nr:hypothetical protein [Gordonia jinhuaensis]GGB21404.1 hypothetical protein GCM10011489_06960 [Gordonia jinhuaensis]
MARSRDPESRPISVAELLARSGENPPSQSRTRRRAREGSLSVAELTGEIPRISKEDLEAADRADAQAAEAQAAEAQAGSTTESGRRHRRAAEAGEAGDATETIESADSAAGETSTPAQDAVVGSDQVGGVDTDGADTDGAVTDGERISDDAADRREEPFPTSDDPVPAREDTERTDEPFPHSEPPAPQPPVQETPGRQMPASQARPMPPTRDISQSEIARRLDPRDDDSADQTPADDAATGIIPRVRGDEFDPAILADDDRDTDEYDFDRYRNFADAQTPDPQASPAVTSADVGVKRSLISRLFGRGARTQAAAGAAEAADDTSTQTTGRAAVTNPLDRAGVVDTDHETPDTGHENPETGHAETGRRAVSDTEVTDPDITGAAADEPTSRRSGPLDLSEFEHEFDAADRAESHEKSTVSGRRTGADDLPGASTNSVDTDEAGSDTAETPPSAPAALSSAVSSRTAASSTAGSFPASAPTAATSDTTSGDAGADTSSPGRQWLVFVTEIVLGVAVGVGLFWGFTELWKWNVYFALVLAIVVIFGLVTMVHIVRKTPDLLTTFLALAVGLIVTIGPLAFLASTN